MEISSEWFIYYVNKRTLIGALIERISKNRWNRVLKFIIRSTKNLIDKPVVRDEQNVIRQFPDIRVSYSNYLYNNATLSNKHCLSDRIIQYRFKKKFIFATSLRRISWNNLS